MEPGEKNGGKNRKVKLKERGKGWARGLVKAANVVTYPTLPGRNRTERKEIRSLHKWLLSEQTNKQMTGPTYSNDPPPPRTILNKLLRA